MCEHEVDEDNTCMLCGECNIPNLTILTRNVPLNSFTYTKPRIMLSIIDRRLINFRYIMSKKSGKQPFRLKPKELRIITEVITFLYKENINERRVRDVLKKLKLNKYINDSYLISCILLNTQCERFDKYEAYFEYIYIKLFNLYTKLYPYKYFISSAFVLSQLLNEVGINSMYWFKNIDTFENQKNIYNMLRSTIPLTYTEFITAKPI